MHASRIKAPPGSSRRGKCWRHIKIWCRRLPEAKTTWWKKVNLRTDFGWQPWVGPRGTCLPLLLLQICIVSQLTGSRMELVQLLLKCEMPWINLLFSMPRTRCAPGYPMIKESFGPGSLMGEAWYSGSSAWGGGSKGPSTWSSSPSRKQDGCVGWQLRWFIGMLEQSNLQKQTHDDSKEGSVILRPWHRHGSCWTTLNQCPPRLSVTSWSYFLSFRLCQAEAEFQVATCVQDVVHLLLAAWLDVSALDTMYGPFTSSSPSKYIYAFRVVIVPKVGRRTSSR